MNLSQTGIGKFAKFCACLRTIVIIDLYSIYLHTNLMTCGPFY